MRKLFSHFAILVVTASLPAFAGDLMDEFSGFYHSPVILEVDEALDRFGHPQRQWLVSVIRGAPEEVSIVQKKWKIEKGPAKDASQRRILFFGHPQQDSYESMELIIQSQPMERRRRGYEAYKNWLKFLDRYLQEHRLRTVGSGSNETLVIEDPAVCHAIQSNPYFQSRYEGFLNRPEGFRLGGSAGDYQGRFKPLLAIDCHRTNEPQ